MSYQIETAFVEQYSNMITILSQQKGSKLRDKVWVKTEQAERVFFEQIDEVDYQYNSDRHGDTPIMSTPHYRRAVTPQDIEWGDMIDKPDKVKMLIDPTSSYSINGTYTLGRGIDDFIIEAATGTAYTGKRGTTAVTLPATQKVAVDLSGANEGLTINKLIAAKSLFGQNEVDISHPMNVLSYVCAQEQLDDLLKTTQVTSADYNTVKALVQGDVNSFMGFDFVQTQRTAHNSSTDIRTNFAFAKSGIGLNINMDITTNIGVDPGKKFNVRVYLCLSAGATRVEEEKVVQVLCDQSP